MLKNQKGFSLIFAVLIILALIIVGFGIVNVFDANRSTSKNTNASSETSEQIGPEKDIQLLNFGINSLINDSDINLNAVREYQSKGLKGFYVFGDNLPGGRQNPNFEFASIKEGANVVAAIDGIVAHIKEQTDNGNDYEVFIQPKEGSVWTIGYDHIVSLKVKKGDKIKAGDIIGQPARQNNGALRFELQINKDENGKTTHVCPATVIDKSVKDKLLSDLQILMTEWETQTKLELYARESHPTPGCIKPTLTPAEAQGEQ